MYLLFVLKCDVKVSFSNKLLCDPGAEPLKIFSWNYSPGCVRRIGKNMQNELLGSTH